MIIRLLIIDDKPCPVAVRYVSEVGIANVLFAADGLQALALLAAEGGVDIVICDLEMPGLDGMTFLRYASQAGLIRGVLLHRACEPDPDMEGALLQMISLLGLQALGSIGNPVCPKLFKQHMRRFVDHEEGGRQPIAIAGYAVPGHYRDLVAQAQVFRPPWKAGFLNTFFLGLGAGRCRYQNCSRLEAGPASRPGLRRMLLVGNI